jgi:acyl-homoserine-lactone acylase
MALQHEQLAWTAAGPSSPKKAGPSVDRGRIRAACTPSASPESEGLTLDRLIAAAYAATTVVRDLVPRVRAGRGARRRSAKANQDRSRCCAGPALVTASVPTSLAVYWGEDACARVSGRAARRRERRRNAAAKPPPINHRRAGAASTARPISRLAHAVGGINRYRRPPPIVEVRRCRTFRGVHVGGGLTRSARARRQSAARAAAAVAAVRFGDRARRGSDSRRPGDPASPHFGDQAVRYSTGGLRDVYFYRADVETHVERQYHPGR